MCNDSDFELKPIYEVTVELYDGIMMSHIVVGDYELEKVAMCHDSDGDIIWWDFEEI